MSLTTQRIGNSLKLVKKNVQSHLLPSKGSGKKTMPHVDEIMDRVKLLEEKVEQCGQQPNKRPDYSTTTNKDSKCEKRLTKLERETKAKQIEWEKRLAKLERKTVPKAHRTIF